MLTLNSDVHPLMNRMHKPDPKSGGTSRTTVALEPADWVTWSRAPLERAQSLMRLSPVETFDAGLDLAE